MNEKKERKVCVCVCVCARSVCVCEVSRIDEGGRDVCTALSVLPGAASGGSADDAGKKGLSQGRGTGRISHSYRCSRGCVVRMARGKTKNAHIQSSVSEGRSGKRRKKSGG